MTVPTRRHGRTFRALRSQLGASGWLFASTGATAALSYIAVSLSAHVLGPAEFGLLGVLAGIASLAAVALDPVYTLATHLAEVAAAQRGRASLRELTGPVLAGSGLAGLVSLAILLLLAGRAEAFLHASGNWPAPLLAALLAVLIASSIGKGFLSGLQRFRAFAAVVVLEAMVRAAVTGPLALLFGASGAFGAYILGLSGSAALSIFLVGGVGWQLPSWRELSRPGKTAASTGLITLLVAALQNGDLVLLRSYARAEDVGLYAAAAALGGTVFFLGTPLFLAAFPRTLAAHRLGQDTRPTLLATLGAILAGGLAAVLLANWLGPFASTLIFGAKFQAIGLLLPVQLGKATGLLVLMTVGQHAVAVGRAGAVRGATIPVLACFGLVALLHPAPLAVALLVATSACCAAALVVAALAAPSRSSLTAPA